MKVSGSAVMVAVVLTCAFSSPAVGETPPKVARIGVLCGGQCEGAAYDELREGLRRLGWVEGRNLMVESRGAGGQVDRLPALATELLALKPNLVVAVGPQPNRAMKDATSALPIVMIGVADPVRMGLAQSLARPGGNVTGFSTLVPEGFIAKGFELLKEAVPRATRIAAMINPTNEIHRTWFPNEAPPAARKLGVRLQVLEVRAASELEGAIDAAVRERADALLVIGDPLFHSPPERLPGLALRARLPALFLPRTLALAGGLMSHGPDFLEMFRGAAGYVDRILKGATPADLPIQQPTRFQLVVNLKTAKALGLTIPRSLLQRADEVLE